LPTFVVGGVLDGSLFLSFSLKKSNIFVITDESTLTQYSHPMPIIYNRVHCWCWALCEFEKTGQIHWLISILSLISFINTGYNFIISS
jgi:hypothetical protein